MLVSRSALSFYWKTVEKGTGHGRSVVHVYDNGCLDSYLVRPVGRSKCSRSYVRKGRIHSDANGAW